MLPASIILGLAIQKFKTDDCCFTLIHVYLSLLDLLSLIEQSLVTSTM